MTIQWKVLFDWDANGVWPTSGPGEETEYTKSLVIRRGRTSSVNNDGYVFVDTGTLALVMNNHTRRFTHLNSSGVLYNYLRPNKPVKVIARVDGVDYNLFTGMTKDIRPSSNEKVAYIDAVDGIDWLKRRKGDSIDVQTDYSVTNAITALLTTAGWPYADTSGWVFPATLGTDSYLGSSLIDDIGDIIPVWWGEPKKTVWDQIAELAEAYAGNPFVRSDGTFAYQARQTGANSVLTLVDGAMSQETEYRRDWKDIRNEIQVTARPRASSGTGVEIWRLYDTPYISAGDSITIWAEYQYNSEFAPAASVTTPVATTDYTANTQEDGGGTNKTSALSVTMTAYATQAKLVLENTDSVGIYVTLFKLRGELWIAPNKTTATASDSTSQAAYNKQALTVDNIWMQDFTNAQNHANYAKILNSYTRKVLWVKIKGATATQFQIDLFDQVTVTSTYLGTGTSSFSDDFWVTYIEHEVINKNYAVTTLRLEPTAQELGGFWTFSTTIGTASTLGW